MGGGAAAVRARSRGLPSGSDDASGGAAPSQPAGVEALAAALSACGGGDWGDRVAALGALVDVARREKHLLAAPAHAMRVADELAQRLSDGNNKVTLAAVAAAEALVPLLRGDAADRAAPVLLPQLAACLL